MSEKGISVFMDEQRLFPPREEMQKAAHISSMEQYEEMYKRSVEDPEGFWAEAFRSMIGKLTEIIKSISGTAISGGRKTACERSWRAASS